MTFSQWLERNPKKTREAFKAFITDDDPEHLFGTFTGGIAEFFACASRTADLWSALAEMFTLCDCPIFFEYKNSEEQWEEVE